MLDFMIEENKNGLMYTPDSDKPYTGEVLSKKNILQVKKLLRSQNMKRMVY